MRECRTCWAWRRRVVHETIDSVNDNTLFLQFMMGFCNLILRAGGEGFALWPMHASSQRRQPTIQSSAIQPVSHSPSQQNMQPASLLSQPRSANQTACQVSSLRFFQGFQMVLPESKRVGDAWPPCGSETHVPGVSLSQFGCRSWKGNGSPSTIETACGRGAVPRPPKNKKAATVQNHVRHKKKRRPWYRTTSATEKTGGHGTEPRPP